MRTRTQAIAEHDWLTPAEFGERVGGVKADTVCGWIKEGLVFDVMKLPNGHYRIPVAEVERFQAEHTINPTDEHGAAA